MYSDLCFFLGLGWLLPGISVDTQIEGCGDPVGGKTTKSAGRPLQGVMIVKRWMLPAVFFEAIIKYL